jgi:protein subunit release factor A
MREHIPEFSYTKRDFRLDWYSGSGAGGQKRNKTQNCLRLTHLPSGITVVAADHKERPANQKAAFRRLKPLLEKWIREQIDSAEYPRSNELVRTYHVVDNEVRDHSTGITVSWDQIEKHFDDLVQARARQGAGNTQSGR